MTKITKYNVSLQIDDSGEVELKTTENGLQANLNENFKNKISEIDDRSKNNETNITNQEQLISENKQAIEDLKIAKQDKLISDGENQNIKTINNESILGKGNIEVSSPLDEVLEKYRTVGGDFFVKLKEKPYSTEQATPLTLIYLEWLQTYFKDGKFISTSNTNGNKLLGSTSYAEPLMVYNGQLNVDLIQTRYDENQSNLWFKNLNGGSILQIDHKNNKVLYKEKELGTGNALKWEIVDTSDFQPGLRYMIKNWDGKKYVYKIFVRSENHALSPFVSIPNDTEEWDIDEIAINNQNGLISSQFEENLTYLKVYRKPVEGYLGN